MGRLFMLYMLGSALFAASAYSQSVDSSDPATLYQRFKPAVVKIIGTDLGIEAGSFGTGFFVSPDGEMITNLHVLRDALRNSTYSVRFLLADGTIIKRFQIAGCSDDRKIDLCLIKINHRPKVWFKMAKAQPTIGQRVFAIGHPHGLNFSFSAGMLSGTRVSSQKVREIQVTAPINPGNSGGPIFDGHGSVLGVATYILNNSEGLNFGIAAAEITSYLNSHREFVTDEKYRNDLSAQIRNLALDLKKKYIDPAKLRLAKGESIADILGDKRIITLKIKDREYIVRAPGDYDNCKPLTEKAGIAVICEGGPHSILSVMASIREPGFKLESLHGKTLWFPEPLATVRYLQSKKLWEGERKKLTAMQQKYLFSVPHSVSCKENPKLPFSNKTECSYEIFNSINSGAVSYYKLYQDADVVLTSKIWTDEAALSHFYFELNDLVASSFVRSHTADRQLASPQRSQ